MRIYNLGVVVEKKRIQINYVRHIRYNRCNQNLKNSNFIQQVVKVFSTNAEGILLSS